LTDYLQPIKSIAMDVYSTIYQLYPYIEAYAKGVLDLDGHHKMYWEVSGNPDGLPVVFLHGGPGAGASPSHRRFFDPEHYKIIIFDQRGSGRSEPFADITDNTTQHLVADLETLRQHLRVETWLIFGGSWGSSLALAYGLAHPDRVAGFVLRGLFLCTQKELAWFFDGIQTVFPEKWRDFKNYLPKNEQNDLLHAYHERLVSLDEAIHQPAARVWGHFEEACSTLLPSSRSLAGLDSGHVPLALARIESHYFVNNFFLPDNYFFENIDKISHIPAVIVQGRYDMICPIVTADKLVQDWSKAKLVIVPDAGHSAMEPAVRSALISATEWFKLS
jgi:proline iminopeptidase